MLVLLASTIAQPDLAAVAMENNACKQGGSACYSLGNHCCRQYVALRLDLRTFYRSRRWSRESGPSCAELVSRGF
jgi:hypothetical protein